MNERIKELFKQTSLHRNDHTTEQRIAEINKFAELIVRECANVAAEHDALDIYEEIREHFGVEL